MGLRMLGDSAWLFEAGGSDPTSRLELILKLVKLLEMKRIPEVRDVVSSFETLSVHFDPGDGETVLDWLTTLPPSALDATTTDEGPSIDIPMVYGGTNGPDLDEVAKALGRTEAEVIDLHKNAEYTVAAVGFSPGFPYLLGLPEQLRLPRQSTPRPVRAGSVAIAGGQSGVYPNDSQGGWHVLGHTNARIFDPLRPTPSMLQPGDRVRFVQVEQLASSTEPSLSPQPSKDDFAEVIEPGALTTVQDLGRPGLQKLGVSPGGVADPVSAQVANRLVGNPDETALLECCMTGPLLKLHKAARVAWLGWADKHSGKPVEVPAGGEIDLRGRIHTLRGYVAISGGIDVPLVMGSRATDVRAVFGGHCGRTLKRGDRVPIGSGTEGPRPGQWRVAWPHSVATGEMLELRFVKGIQAGWFSKEAKEKFKGSIYQVSPASDRMGVRLDGPILELMEPRELVSQPVVRGSVQVPPDGRPIVLMAEHQTIGGYPQIGHIISADLSKLARAWPGTRLRFREVSLDEAREAWRKLQCELGFLQAGLNLRT